LKRAFRDDDDAELGAPGVAVAQPLRNDGDVEWDFGDQDRVGATRHAGVERDPPGVPTHHLDDHDAVVRLGGGVQPIDGVGCEINGGIEAETVGGSDDVVVDRLRDADDRDAAVVEPVGDRQRAIAADDDQRIEAHLVEHLDDAIRVVTDAFRRGDRIRERVAAVGRAENRSTKTQDPGHVARRQSS
jgi:hypothetical protein